MLPMNNPWEATALDTGVSSSKGFQGAVVTRAEQYQGRNSLVHNLPSAPACRHPLAHWSSVWHPWRRSYTLSATAISTLWVTFLKLHGFICFFVVSVLFWFGFYCQFHGCSGLGCRHWLGLSLCCKSVLWFPWVVHWARHFISLPDKHTSELLLSHLKWHRRVPDANKPTQYL